MLSVSDFNDFEVFAIVANEGSLRGAAQRLSSSQPAVSQRVTRLERNLGTPLFERSTSGVRLTEAGEKLLPYLRRALHLMNEAVAAVKDTAPTPTLEVWTDSTLAPVIVPFVSRTLQGIPVSLSNRTATIDETVTAVRDGDADIGFIHGDVHTSHLETYPFFKDELCFVVGPDHPLAGADSVTVADVVRYDVAISMCAPGSDIATSHLSVAGIPPERLRRVTPAATAAMLSMWDHHVGACLRSSIRRALDLEMLKVLRIDDLPPWKVEIRCILRPSKGSSAPLRILKEAVGAAWDTKTILI